MARRLFFRKIRGAEKFWLVTKNAALRRACSRYETPRRKAVPEKMPSADKSPAAKCPFPINRPAGRFRHEKPYCAEPLRH